MTRADPIAALERFAGTRAAIILALAWGFAEAIAFPVVPDVLLGIFALAAPRRAVPVFLAAVGGALVGSVVLAALAAADPAAIRGLLLTLPGIHVGMLDDAARATASGDPLALALFGPGTPLKVYTAAWIAGAGSVPGLLLAIAINRVTRIVPGVATLAIAGIVAPGWVRRHGRAVTLGYAAFWIGLYAWYWA